MFEKIFDAIKQHKNIVIFGHIYPDGDCYGSQIGLRDSLRMAFPEKNIYAVGSGLPNFFQTISTMDVVNDEIIKDSLAIIVDANDISRLEDSRSQFAKAHVKIDHHIDYGSFTEGPQVVDEDAESTCTLIYRFIIENNLPLPKSSANAIYLGILTDTGKFQYVFDYVKLFATTSDLCSHGAEPKKINRILNIAHEENLKLKGYILSNYKKTKDGVLYVYVPYSVCKSLGVDPRKNSNLVNLLGNVKNYPICVAFMEQESGNVFAEMRSDGLSVQPVAAKYGGGGHLTAAGITYISNFTDELMHKIIADLDEVVRKG